MGTALIYDDEMTNYKLLWVEYVYFDSNNLVMNDY